MSEMSKERRGNLGGEGAGVVAVPGRCRKTNRPSRLRAVGYWQLVAAGEPFRLLFPLGTLIGVVGVMMWPLYLWGGAGMYPGQAHARIMIEGFLACFVVGFLGTALPRLLDVPRLRLWETLALALALVVVVVWHYAGWVVMGDVMFMVTLVGLGIVLGRRWRFRKDTPPPGFVLVVLGLLSGLFGAATQVALHVSPELMPGWLMWAGRLLLYQGFLLLPIMGVGAFLLPRFFDLPNRQSFPSSLALPPGWLWRAFFALVCGLAVIVSFGLEARGHLALGRGMRAAVVLLYFVREVPVHRAGFGGGSLAMGLRIALISIPLGYASMAIWPDQMYTLLHIVLISGFSLLTFIVASRVILGHSGQADRFRARIWPVVVLISLIVLAMLTRVAADWMPAVTLTHYGYAALSWVAGVLVWAVYVLKDVRRADVAD